MMYDHEKSDPAIVAMKPTNKARQLAAESAEPRAGAEGNVSQQKHGPGTVPGNRVTGADAHTAFRENITTRRYTPEVGAACPNWARTDLCGAREVTRVPTANISLPRDGKPLLLVELRPVSSRRYRARSRQRWQARRSDSMAWR